MLIEKEIITNYIPQRAPFVMIDALKTADDTGFTSLFEVTDSNLFLGEDNVLSESALVENVAQTCAAGFGYLNSLKTDSEPQLGFIGAVSKLSVEKLPFKGAILDTKVEIINAFETIHLVEGTVTENGEVLLSCQMKIVLA